MAKRLTKREIESLLDVSIGKPTCIDARDAAAGRGRQGFTHVELRANLTPAQAEIVGKKRLSKTAYLPTARRRYETELKSLAEEFRCEAAEKIRKAAASQGIIPGADGTQTFYDRAVIHLEAKGALGDEQAPTRSARYMLEYTEPLNALALEDITVDDVRACVIAARDSPRGGRWAGKQDDDGPKDATAYNILCFIRGVFDDAVDAGVVEASPADSEVIRKAFPRPRAKRIDPFLPEEQARIRRAILEMPGAWHRIAFLILLTCGLRREEVLALQHQDLDFGERPALHVRRAAGEKGGVKETKTPAGCRTIRLSRLTAAVLEEWEEERRAFAARAGVRFSGRWFLCSPHIDRCAHGNSLNRHWARLMASLEGEVPYRNLYQMRHSFAVTMIRAKVDLLTVSRLLGHADPLVTINRYLRWMPDAGHEAAERFMEVLDGYDDVSSYLDVGGRFVGGGKRT